MRLILLLSLIVNLTTLFGQHEPAGIIISKDTCDKIKSEIMNHSISGTRHCNPLFVANEVVVRADQLDTTLIGSLNVLKCPESFSRFNYVGVNGAIIIKTKQNFKFITPVSIRSDRRVKGTVLYALNGYELIDTLLHISIEAIKDVDVLITEDGSSKNKNQTTINIWTLTKEERNSVSGLCSVVRHFESNFK